MNYRADIDGLRAVAVLAVVAFHAFPTLLPGGFIGVDIFFVISGYLISTIIFEGLESGTFNFGEFYSRRIKRIFPALIIILLACLIFGWFALLADEYAQLGKHIAAGASFVSNFILWGEAGYFDNEAHAKPLLHLWSLGIEEQFYIVWPILLWFAWKRKFSLLTIIILVAIASFVLNVKGIKQDMVSSFYSPHTRFWELLSGSLLAWVTLYKKDILTNLRHKLDYWPSRVVYNVKKEADGRTLSNVLSFVGLLLLAYGFWQITKEVSFPGKWAVIPVLGAILIILAGPKAWINRKILSNKLAIWLGLISFPLYLWHWPVLTFARILRGDELSPTITVIALIFSGILAWLTYILIECRVRGVENDKKIIFSLVSLLVLVGLIGLLVFFNQGFISRHNLSLNDKKVRGWNLKGSEVTDCSYLLKGTSDAFCASTESPEIAIIGDSHAGVLFYGFSNNTINKQYQNIIVYGAPTCQPSYGVEARKDCNKQLTIALEKIIENKKIHTVFITGYYHFFDNFNSEISNKYVDGYLKTIKMLQLNGKRVVFVIDNPALKKSAQLCAPKPLWMRQAFNSFPEFCNNLTDADFRDQTEYLKFIEEIRLRSKDVIFYSPSAVICPNRQCKIYHEGLLLYGDFNHLSKYGSLLVANDLILRLSK